MKTKCLSFPQCQYLPSGDRLMSEEDRCQVGYLIFCATGWVPPPASSPWTNQLAVVGIIVTMHDWAQITTWALLLLGREQPGTSSMKPSYIINHPSESVSVSMVCNAFLTGYINYLVLQDICKHLMQQYSSCHVDKNCNKPR